MGTSYSLITWPYGGFIVRIDGLDQKVDAVDARLTVKIDAIRNEMIAEIRRVDTRIEGVDRELRTANDSRERLAALKARHPA
jgi:hypothetical protein